MIPFSPPYISEDAIKAVEEVLRSGWITTGPKVKQLEKDLKEYVNAKGVICLNSATASLELALRWFGVGKGDEVILPAYTYAATANVIVHCGAKPVFVDICEEDMNISIEEIRKHVNSRTKAIMPVDFAGFPCSYDEILNIALDNKDLFEPSTEEQKRLGRILLVSDAAHSVGGEYKGAKVGGQVDFAAFSFHAVKNLTTAEGGALCFNLPTEFDADEIYKRLSILSLHGQDKDALAKLKKSSWQYDIVEAGYKCNMTDIQAALGLVNLHNYDELLKRRSEVFHLYSKFFKEFPWAHVPMFENEEKRSSYHVYPLRIKGITEDERNRMMQYAFDHDVSVNVHFKPVPLMSFYKNKGYDIINYPVAHSCYVHEISLPVYYTLTDEQVNTVCNVLAEAYQYLGRS